MLHTYLQPGSTEDQNNLHSFKVDIQDLFHQFNLWLNLKYDHIRPFCY